MSHPIETGNIVLMVVGAALIAAGPYIIYRTVTGVMRERKKNPDAPLLKTVQPISNGINLLIGVSFFFAGILFIVNNLRGNPLH